MLAKKYIKLQQHIVQFCDTNMLVKSMDLSVLTEIVDTFLMKGRHFHGNDNFSVSDW